MAIQHAYARLQSNKEHEWHSLLKLDEAIGAVVQINSTLQTSWRNRFISGLGHWDCYEMNGLGSKSLDRNGPGL